ncbi:hypothetical protein GOBAR_AA25653 [Gossypium barbadense]|uniref:Transposase MuDR plant domain-containing protein n=1 Tax=Gossypium barbadense TaxID=3634 RepID=A0A2P5WVB0_GOSBA|nr:hypothetical protein GOBAR_AA25653 [Gossypium barbadense]
MELVNDKDVKTMVTLYCRDRSRQTNLIQLFAELAYVELAKDSTPLGEERGVQDPCIVTDANGDDGYDNNGSSNHEVVNYSDLDLDEVQMISMTKAQMTMEMLIRLQLETRVEYPDILPTHRLAVDFERKEFFMGQKFATKEECIFSIKCYNMNVSIDYKVAMSKSTLYIGKCWRSKKGYN